MTSRTSRNFLSSSEAAAPPAVSFGSRHLVPERFALSTPVVVPMTKAHLALLAAGKLQAVQDAIDTLPSPTREQAQIWWDRAGEVRRDHPMVIAIAPLLGLDDAGVDALFVAAAAITD